MIRAAVLPQRRAVVNVRQIARAHQTPTMVSDDLHALPEWHDAATAHTAPGRGGIRPPSRQQRGPAVRLIADAVRCAEACIGRACWCAVPPFVADS